MIGLYTPMRVTARGLVLGAALLASAAFSYAKEGDAELIAARSMPSPAQFRRTR